MKAKEKFLIEATKQYGQNAIITKTQVQDTLKSLGIMGFGYGHLVQAGMSAGNDTIKLQSVDVSKTDVAVVTKKEVVKEVVKETSQDNTTVNLVMGSDIQNLVPSPFEGFVSWGHHSTIKQVVKSKMFYPIFVTGLSGNGKTLMIEQVCAKLNKELGAAASVGSEQVQSGSDSGGGSSSGVTSNGGSQGSTGMLVDSSQSGDSFQLDQQEQQTGQANESEQDAAILIISLFIAAPLTINILDIPSMPFMSSTRFSITVSYTHLTLPTNREV